MAVNHITLGVGDLERSFRFYTEILAATPRMKTSVVAYLDLQSTWIALVEQQPPPTPIGAQGYTHIAFSATQPQIDRLRDFVTQGLLSNWQENQSEGDSIYFLDPDGNKFEYHTTSLEDRLALFRRNPDPAMELFD
ncbi:MAG: glutathione transferase [Candidatus Latescibacteria bacterium]|nr:glutathione transferase [Candidatus Latescibacterota bacterium]